MIAYSNYLHANIRVRKAKKTPTKAGYFVAFWEKDSDNKNQPFHASNSPKYLVIIVQDDEKIGYFNFPKQTLIDKQIVTSETGKGKMGMRVYPTWCETLNKTAQRTQYWQSDYFTNLSQKKI